jgi:hypothetical protein
MVNEKLIKKQASLDFLSGFVSCPTRPSADHIESKSIHPKEIHKWFAVCATLAGSHRSLGISCRDLLQNIPDTIGQTACANQVRPTHLRVQR